ncbi:MAG: Gfo/Idh/MocA family oxidoreductase [Pirellulales bacterium]|jgi:predicted dehydrogenase|nr:Gfo/Idh/MocA family oxidoreductase [Thermoguttaceae bacterium]MDD4785567.1 Gfo/Idh/MocA family oxidoreductase [Pirellulales bacterium]MDI9445391.1 Gfo/Idh/MocA family oxidoreductase [Planctomycetota bacterium]NLZ00618.1 Gfo/Idh/MocA family oxidoreductase [Pirellulaceae bacterium]
MNHETPCSRRTFLAASGLAATGAILPGGVSAAPTANPGKKQPIKIGQIGTGNQHAYKIGTLRRLTDLFDVVGFVEDDPKLRERAQKSSSFKGLKVMSTDELLAVPGLQAVAIETEERVCIPPALRCIQAGKHIHLDKPCGESLPKFKQLLDEAKARNLTVQVGYMYRNNPAVQFCIKAVKDGLIGNVFDLDTAMGRYDGAGYRNLIKDYKGGIAYILACHLIDIIVSLMGEPVKINPYLRQTRSDGVLDNCLAVFEFSRDRLATVRTSITEAKGFQRRRLKVMGDKGSIIIQPIESQGNMSGGVLTLALEEDRGGFTKGIQTVDMPPLKDRYEDQWREFAAVLNGEMVNPYTYEHDYTVHKCHLEACGLPLDV